MADQRYAIYKVGSTLELRDTRTQTNVAQYLNDEGGRESAKMRRDQLNAEEKLRGREGEEVEFIYYRASYLTFTLVRQEQETDQMMKERARDVANSTPIEGWTDPMLSDPELI